MENIINAEIITAGFFTIVGLIALAGTLVDMVRDHKVL